MATASRVSSLLISETAELWTSLRSGSPIASPFNNIEFVRTLTESIGVEPNVLVVEDNNVAVAAMLLHVRRKGPFTEVVIPPFVPETPMVLAELPTESATNQARSVFNAIEKYLRVNYDAARVHLPTAINDPRTFQWSGWNVSPLYTPVANIPVPFNTSSWSKGTVQLLDKNKNNFSIHVDASNIDSIVNLVIQSYGRSNRTPPLDEAGLHNLLTKLDGVGMIDVFTAVSNDTGTVDAGVVLLREGTHSCYWIAGSEPGPAMTVLIGEIFNALSSSVVNEIDFVGANTASIAEFKRHFGTELRQYHSCAVTSSRLLRILKAVREVR